MNRTNLAAWAVAAVAMGVWYNYDKKHPKEMSMDEIDSINAKIKSRGAAATASSPPAEPLSNEKSVRR